MTSAGIRPDARRPRRVIVTGAGGFVGANLVRRLLGDGHEVTALCTAGGAWRLDDVASHVELLTVDVRDSEGVRAVVSRVRPEWIFHLAAWGGYSWQIDPRTIYETNVLGTSNVIAAALEVRAEALVHAGSSSEYGLKDHAPAEDEVLEPNSDYAIAKAAATHICALAARDRDLPAVTLRLYSVYGPFEDPRRLVPRLIGAGLRGGLPTLVAPDTARDFVHVDDVCSAFVHAAALSGTSRGSVYNVGSGRQTTVAELVECVRGLLAVEAEPEWGSMPPRRWDTGTWVANVERLTAAGWSRSRDLERGIRDTIAWFQDNPQVWHVYGLQAAEARQG